MGSIGFNSQSQLQVNGTAVNWGKNYIINGGFDSWYYATSQTTNGYGSDNRWNNINNGSTKTHSQVVSSDTERALFNSPYFSRTAVSSVAGVDNSVVKRQTIENITKLAGKTVTISFWAKADANKNIAIELMQVFGSGGTPSALVVGIGAQLVSLTSTWQKKTITVTFPSILGKTLGTDGVNTSYTGITFWFDAGSNNNARTANLGQQSGTFDIAEVQLEEGSVATPWTPYNGEFGGEVQACQRYFCKSYNDLTPIGTGTLVGSIWNDDNYGTRSGTTFTYIKFPVNMRLTPTLTSYSPVTGASGMVRNAATATDVAVSAHFSSLGSNGVTFGSSSNISNPNEYFTAHFSVTAEL